MVIPQMSWGSRTAVFVGFGLLAVLPAAASRATPTRAKIYTAAAVAPTTRTVIASDTTNNSSITLHQGDKLVLTLDSNASTGYSWAFVHDPGFPLELTHHAYVPKARPATGLPMVGGGGTEEFEFTVGAKENLATMNIGEWLRMLYLRPFVPGIKDFKLFQIHLTITGR